MQVDELKNFFCLRGLKTAGRKQELVARVFVAIETTCNWLRQLKRWKRSLQLSYEAKLVIDYELIPDSFKTTGGWLEEKDAVAYCPTTLYPDIYVFLAFDQSKLKATDLGDTDAWLHSLYYHPVTESSKYCIFKTTRRPSQKITDIPHKLWICI